MNTLHDDLPHPVPPMAYLRWKENYFFIVLDADNDIFGVCHFNYEPGFDRARMSFNFTIRGKLFSYSNQIPFPQKFEMSKILGDQKLNLTIEKSHELFRLEFHGEDILFNLDFNKRLDTFDFSACKYAAPELPSCREVLTLGTNLPFEHLQQAMWVTGHVRIKGDDAPINVNCYGYRDHSWCMRSDNLNKNHTWCALNFPDMVIGVMTVEQWVRPGLVVKEGYVADKDGIRALRGIEISQTSLESGQKPATIIHRLRDVYGKVFTVESYLNETYSQVPLAAEVPNSGAVYEISEIFCPSKLIENSLSGISLVELGEIRK